MNKLDEKIIQRLAERLVSGTAPALECLKACYALGIARETFDHSKQGDIDNG